MRTRGWTKEQDKKLIEFCNSETFVSAKDMAKEIGKAPRTMQTRMKELKIKRKSFPWTKEQDEVLIKLYPNKKIPIDTIVEEVNKVEGAFKRSREGVLSRANILNLKRESNSKKLQRYLIKNYKKNGISAKDIAAKFDRPVKTVYRMASDLNLTSEIKVTTKQVEYVVKNYEKMNVYIMSAKLGIPEHSIRKIAYKHNLKKPKKKKVVKKKIKLWDKHREEFIKKNCLNMTMQEMADELKIPYTKVKSKVASMGLKDRNLKMYKVGNISFKYFTVEEKQRKLDYVIMFRDLISKAGIGDVYK